jgi:hypothetical protein
MSGGAGDRPAAPPPAEEPPPILGTWRRLYGFVILWLLVQMAIYFAFTRYFS